MPKMVRIFGRLARSASIVLLLLLVSSAPGGAADLLLPSGVITAVLTAEEVNQQLIDQGSATPATLPFTPGTSVVQMRQTQTAWYVRYYAEDPSRLKGGAVGGWIIPPRFVLGKTAAQVRDLYALPQFPDHFTVVRVPAGTSFRTGWANPIPIWGQGGGQQFLLTEYIAISDYHPQGVIPQEVYSSAYAQRISGGNADAVASYLDSLPPGAVFSHLDIVRFGLDYSPPSQLQQALEQISPARFDVLTRLGVRDTLLFARSLPWPSAQVSQSLWSAPLPARRPQKTLAQTPVSRSGPGPRSLS